MRGRIQENRCNKFENCSWIGSATRQTSKKKQELHGAFRCCQKWEVRTSTLWCGKARESLREDLLPPEHSPSERAKREGVWPHRPFGFQTSLLFSGERSLFRSSQT